jgi:hypothetical protein
MKPMRLSPLHTSRLLAMVVGLLAALAMPGTSQAEMTFEECLVGHANDIGPPSTWMAPEQFDQTMTWAAKMAEAMEVGIPDAVARSAPQSTTTRNTATGFVFADRQGSRSVAMLASNYRIRNLVIPASTTSNGISESDINSRDSAAQDCEGNRMLAVDPSFVLTSTDATNFFGDGNVIRATTRDVTDLTRT